MKHRKSCIDSLFIGCYDNFIDGKEIEVAYFISNFLDVADTGEEK